MVWINLDAREKNIWVYITLIFFYSALGGMLESTLYFFSDKKKYIGHPIFPGFPIYAVGAYIVVFLHRAFAYKLPFIAEFALYGAVLCAIEYIIGKIGKAGPKSYMEGHDGKKDVVEAWDYTDQTVNIQGIIDIRHFITYGLLSIIVTRVHPLLVDRINRMFSGGQRFKRYFKPQEPYKSARLVE